MIASFIAPASTNTTTGTCGHLPLIFCPSLSEFEPLHANTVSYQIILDFFSKHGLGLEFR